jgi:RNA polymerase sigma-70 factor (ECF subfamily)
MTVRNPYIQIAPSCVYNASRGCVFRKMQEQATRHDNFDAEAIMLSVASGDSQALEILYNRYGRVVYGLALKILADPEHAEEVVQEAFWRVWTRSATFQARSGQFTPWLFGITRNLCIDELRRRQSRPRTIPNTPEAPDLGEFVDAHQDVEDQTWENERRRLIVNALKDLPDDQREVVELAYFAGLSQREVAERISSPLGTVKTRMRLALQKLKSHLQLHDISLEEH